MSESTTTILVYSGDHAWLRERQRKVSFERNRTVPMCDLMRELVEYVRGKEAAAEVGE
jgi:hypothetical protein